MSESITVGQIINLHEIILQNDGFEFARPLCLVLSTRPNFLARFAKLTSGASEGKGLSELVYWDEQSESFDDSAPVNGNDQGERSQEEINKADANLETGEDNNVPTQHAFNQILPQDRTAEKDPAQEAGDTDSHETSRTVANDSLVQHSTAQDVVAPQNMEASGNVEDEDGDLIDYSDVEDEAQPELQESAKSRPAKLEIDGKGTNTGTPDFISPCLKHHSHFCSKCDDLLLVEYEAINEELRRRSIPPKSEKNLLEQAAESLVANYGTDNKRVTTLETENRIEYDDHDGDALSQANQAPEHGDRPTDCGGVYDTNLNEPEDELHIEDRDENRRDDIVDDDNLTTDPSNEEGQEPFDEFDFEEDDDAQHLSHSTFAGQMTPVHNSDAATPTASPNLQSFDETFSTGSSLEVVEAPDSGSAASERTLDAQALNTEDLTSELNQQDEDEIDYDDEEESYMLQIQEPNVTELQASTKVSGKRQRVDDASTIAESKGRFHV